MCVIFDSLFKPKGKLQDKQNAVKLGTDKLIIISFQTLNQTRPYPFPFLNIQSISQDFSKAMPHVHNLGNYCVSDYITYLTPD